MPTPAVYYHCIWRYIQTVTMSISDSPWSENRAVSSGASTPPVPCNLYAETVKPAALHVYAKLSGWENFFHHFANICADEF